MWLVRLVLFVIVLGSLAWCVLQSPSPTVAPISNMHKKQTPASVAASANIAEAHATLQTKAKARALQEAAATQAAFKAEADAKELQEVETAQAATNAEAEARGLQQAASAQVAQQAIKLRMTNNRSMRGKGGSGDGTPADSYNIYDEELSRWADMKRLKPDDVRVLQTLGVEQLDDLDALRGLAMADLFDGDLEPPPSVVQKARLFKALNGPSLKDEP